jgi:phenylacetate-CoA ligase
VRGVNVFPSQIESVLVGMEEIGPHYEIVVYTENFMDRLEVKVELADAQCLDSYANLERLEAKVKHNIFSMLNINVKVSLAEPYTLKRFEGKAQRVTDLRKK